MTPGKAPQIGGKAVQAVLACLILCTSAGAIAQPLESATLRKIRDTGVIAVGHRVASAPFSFLDARRRPVGYTIDICEHIVKAISTSLGLSDLEVKRVAVSSATRLPMLANGTIDLECGITTNTAERARSVSFSVTTFVAASRLLARKEGEVQTLDDLRGRVVASTLSTTSIQHINAVNQSRQLNLKVIAGIDDQQSFQLVRAGQAAAFAMDDVMLRSLLASAPDAADYSVSSQPLTIEPYAIGLPHGDPVFKQLVDKVITELYRSDEIAHIYRQWFESPIPPKGVNLKWPMSEALRRVIRQPTDASDPMVYR